MKPFELYQALRSFNDMMSDETLTVAQKIDIGREWIRLLPPPQLCVTSELSLKHISGVMRGRLLDLENELGRKGIGESSGGTGLGRTTTAPSKTTKKRTSGVESKP